MLARLGSGFEVCFPIHRIDHRKQHIDVEFTAERAIGGECLQDRRRIGEPGGLNDDPRKTRRQTAFAIDQKLTQCQLQIAPRDAADAAVAEQHGLLGAVAHQSIVNADDAEFIDNHRRSLPLR